MGSAHGTGMHVGSTAFEAREHVDGTGLATLVLAGRLDQVGNDVVEALLVRAWGRWPSAVTVDLRRVEVLDICALASLLRASRTARRRRVPFTLVCCGGPIARLLGLGGLGDQLVEVRRAVPGTNHTAAPSLAAAGKDRRPCPRRPVHPRSRSGR